MKQTAQHEKKHTHVEKNRTPLHQPDSRMAVERRRRRAEAGWVPPAPLNLRWGAVAGPRRAGRHPRRGVREAGNRPIDYCTHCWWGAAGDPLSWDRIERPTVAAAVPTICLALLVIIFWLLHRIVNWRLKKN